MEFDVLLQKKVGEFGRYQILLFVMLSCLTIPEGIIDLSIVFVAGLPDHWCAVSKLHHHGNLSLGTNITIPLKTRLDGTQCNILNLTNSVVERINGTDVEHLPVVGCKNGWQYDRTLYSSTIVTEWDLVCDNKAWIATSEAVTYVGMIFGSAAVGMLADKLGRRNVLWSLQLAGLLVTIVTPFSPNIVIFIILKLFESFTNDFDVSFVMVMEFVGPSWRTFCGLMFSVFYGLGLTLMSLIGYLVRDWKVIYYVMALGQLPFLIYIWFIPKSPRWLYIQNKKHEADKIVRMIARRNKKTISPTEELQVTVQHDEEYSLLSSIRLLLRNSILRKWSFIFMVNWFVVGVVWIGLMLNISDLAGDIYLNNSLAGIIEIPAALISWLLMEKCGRRYTLAIAEILSGLLLLSVSWLPIGLSSNLGVAMAVIGKFFISASYSMIYVYTTETFPTPIRGTALGFCVTSFSIGGALGPYVGDMGKYTNYVPFPMLIFGSLSTIAGMLVFFLPETKGRMLPETVEDAVLLRKSIHKTEVEEEELVEREIVHEKVTTV